jgi:hypothetical protein
MRTKKKVMQDKLQDQRPGHKVLDLIRKAKTFLREKLWQSNTAKPPRTTK